jgi:uncharacterized membrane protein
LSRRSSWPTEPVTPLELADATLEGAVQWVRLAVEAVGALVVVVGFLVSLYGLVRSVLTRRVEGFAPVRRTFARYLALALEFQLGADVLATAVAPTWEAVGKLAVIAVVRTALNYFLALELKQPESGP